MSCEKFYVFYVRVQLLDGFATTTDNVRGLLPDLLGLAVILGIAYPLPRQRTE
jgi:hypothetical protein